MRILYIDASMGAAGDMLTAALTELMPDPAAFVEKLNSLGIPDVTYTAQKAEKCGITGTCMSVRVGGVEEGECEHHHEHDHEHHHDHEHEHHHDHDHHHDHEHGHHHHAGMADIERIVSALDIPPKVREDVMAVYRLIAEAESHVHGKDVTEIHFHEVGTMDAVADVTAVCLAMRELSFDRVVVSPVHVGKGTVHCAHGILPVPAPATEYILRGIPVYGRTEGELCTPTGAALLKYFGDEFGDMPVMAVQNTGYGMGKKDFPQANCVRLMSGTTEDVDEDVAVLSFNVDDMTAEDLSFAERMMFSAGAREVYTIPVCGKKSRAGTLVRVICSTAQKEEIIKTIFKHTSTIGLREIPVKRYTLSRRTETLDTPLGKVRRKVSQGYGVTKVKYEHDDLEFIAAEKCMSIEDVRKEIDNG
ncbi:MAG: nickel pincer cofactor biosynthesis protein LarC [Oscillospiraceae bacterium]|nr:nickel pincer cofactor biosynthesis protein LarC [Oscillospiraceae bacterium]